jgi:hypothetical protein
LCYEKLDGNARKDYWNEQGEPKATVTTAVAAIEEPLNLALVGTDQRGNKETKIK